MKLILAFLTGLAISGSAKAADNFCAGKAAGSFYCLDDSFFEHCTGFDRQPFALEKCPAKLCVTRTPANRNPCVGRAAAIQEDGVAPPVVNGGVVVTANPPPIPNPPVPNPPVAKPPISQPIGNGQVCSGGPAFDHAGDKNVGNGKGQQFIGGHCLSSKDCRSDACCAGPCGICSGLKADFQNGKTGCGFGG